MHSSERPIIICGGVQRPASRLVPRKDLGGGPNSKPLRLDAVRIVPEHLTPIYQLEKAFLCVIVGVFVRESEVNSSRELIVHGERLWRLWHKIGDRPFGGPPELGVE